MRLEDQPKLGNWVPKCPEALSSQAAGSVVKGALQEGGAEAAPRLALASFLPGQTSAGLAEVPALVIALPVPRTPWCVIPACPCSYTGPGALGGQKAHSLQVA